MNEILNSMTDAFYQAYPILYKVSDPGLFLSVIFTMIDQYAADHDIEPKEIMELTRKACDVQKEAYETLGIMDKSVPI